jgi:predicted RNase H-like nuclease (RuvC/YqgF family)
MMVREQSDKERIQELDASLGECRKTIETLKKELEEERARVKELTKELGKERKQKLEVLLEQGPSSPRGGVPILPLARRPRYLQGKG